MADFLELSMVMCVQDVNKLRSLLGGANLRKSSRAVPACVDGLPMLHIVVKLVQHLSFVRAHRLRRRAMKHQVEAAVGFNLAKWTGRVACSAVRAKDLPGLTVPSGKQGLMQLATDSGTV